LRLRRRPLTSFGIAIREFSLRELIAEAFAQGITNTSTVRKTLAIIGYRGTFPALAQTDSWGEKTALAENVTFSTQLSIH
jgi:hypothetical protein